MSVFFAFVHREGMHLLTIRCWLRVTRLILNVTSGPWCYSPWTLVTKEIWEIELSMKHSPPQKFHVTFDTSVFQ